MTKTIYKYPITGEGWVEIPVNADVVKVETQQGIICIWAIVPSHPESKVWERYKIYGTGHEIPMDSEYIGTFFVEPFVWHLFREEVTEEAPSVGQ